MLTAKIFKSGNSQAIRIPKEYSVKNKEMSINKIGDVILLVPKSNQWLPFVKSLDMFTDDFMSEGREQGRMDKRLSL